MTHCNGVDAHAEATFEPMPILIHDTDPAELDRFLSDRLYEFNVAATGIDDGQWLYASIADAQGRLIAGVSGNTWGGCCEITKLWVHEDERHHGLGRRIMAAVETEARRRGCKQIVLTTHSFQAPGFYQSLGFVCLAAVPEYPNGHQNLIYRKHLS